MPDPDRSARSRHTTRAAVLQLLALLVLLLTANTLTGCASASYAAAGDAYAEPSPRFQTAAAEAPMADDEMAMGGEGLDGMFGAKSGEGHAGLPGGAAAPSKKRARGEPTDTRATPDPSASSGTAKGPRMIIYNANLGVYVFDVEVALKKAADATRAAGGWIQQSTTNSLMIRVPVGQFDPLVEGLLGLGNVEFKNITGTDVSEEFFDLQIRLRNAEVLRARYVELLKQSKTVEDSLKIERELGRITEQIERFKGRMKFLRDQSTFSTVTVRFTKRPDAPTQARRAPLPFPWLRSYNLRTVYR